METHLREDCGEDFDFLRLRSGVVHPVHVHTGLANHSHKVELSILLTQAVVGTSTEHEPVLGLLLGVTGDPTVRVEGVRLRVGFWVMGCRPHRRNNHRTLGDGVVLGDGEVLLDHVGNHDDRRAVAKNLLHNSTGVWQVVHEIHRKLDVTVATAGAEVLLADLVKDLRAVSHNLEEPGASGAGRILRRKQESEDSLSNLIVAEVTQNHGRLLRVIDGDTLLDLLTILGRVLLGLDPGVHNARDITTTGHANLALSRTLGEFVHDHISGLLAVPGLSVRQDDGEVDQLEGGSDEVVVVRDLLDRLVAHVVANKGAAGKRAHEFTEVSHPRDGLVVVPLGLLDERLEIAVIDLLHCWEVQRDSLASEQTVQSLAVLNVGLSIQEDPVGLA